MPRGRVGPTGKILAGSWVKKAGVSVPSSVFRFQNKPDQTLLKMGHRLGNRGLVRGNVRWGSEQQCLWLLTLVTINSLALSKKEVLIECLLHTGGVCVG